jgi:hypothetical protein
MPWARLTDAGVVKFFGVFLIFWAKLISGKYPINYSKI